MINSENGKKKIEKKKKTETGVKLGQDKSYLHEQ